jgi:hypothetical protein
MIHAPRKGQRTTVESVKKFAGKHSKIHYRTLIDTL